MIILRGDNGKKIEYVLDNVIHECDNEMYIVEMPLVVCNNKKDAEYIQSKINTFVGELSHTVLNNI